MRGKSSICGKATKGTAKKGEASMFPTRKNTKVQQYIRHAPKRHNIRGEKLEDKVGGSDICRMWQI